MAAGHRYQMLDHRGAIHLHEKIFVRFSLLPELARLLLAFPPGAHRDEHSRMSVSDDKLIVEPFRREFRSVHPQPFIFQFQTAGLPGINPRLPVFRIPCRAQSASSRARPSGA